MGMTAPESVLVYDVAKWRTTMMSCADEIYGRASVEEMVRIYALLRADDKLRSRGQHRAA